MPSQREIRRRIGSVRNIKQITRAMQFVAASKLKRAQDATLAARPYAEKIDEVLADIAARPRRRRASVARPARRRQAPDRADDQRPRPGRLAQHQRHSRASEEITNESGDLKVVTVGARATRRCAAPTCPSRPRSTASASGRTSRRACRVARLLTDDFVERHVHAHRPRLSAVRLDARPAAGRRAAAADRAQRRHGRHPGQPVHLRAEPGAVLRAAPAALRRDARLPGRAGADRQRAIARRWSP